jgi:hypothetical protein
VPWILIREEREDVYVERNQEGRGLEEEERIRLPTTEHGILPSYY